jgi:ketosteroid isomerase-like protein
LGQNTRKKIVFSNSHVIILKVNYFRILTFFRRSLKMKKSILTLPLAVLMMLIFGCQESQVQKANPKQDINKVLVKLQAAYVKQDLDGIMAVYSEDYSGPQGEQKAQVREFLAGVIDQGVLDNTKVDIDDVKIKVEGDTATAAPVTYSGDWGQMDFKTIFKKEGSNWRVIGGEEYYGE